MCTSEIFKKPLIFAVLSGAVTLTTMVGTTAAWADVELIFGTYTADKATETVKKFKPVLTTIASEMTTVMGEPVTIKLKITNDYTQGIKQLADGSVDISRFGPASYVTAKDMNPGIGIVAMELSNGKKVFSGVIAVHKDSDIDAVEDLKGRSFAFGDSLSTIGRYLAQERLLAAGISAENLSNFDFLGRHDRVGSAVGNKDFDAGALKSSTFKKLVAKQVPIRVLAEFDNVTKPWIVRSGLDPRTVAALRHVLTDPKNAEALKSASKYGFTTGTDAEYDIIRDAMKTSENFGG